MENRTQRWGPVPPCVAMGRSQPCLTLGFCEIGTLLIFGLWSPSVGWDGTSEPSSPPVSWEAGYHIGQVSCWCSDSDPLVPTYFLAAAQLSALLWTSD